MAFMPGELVHTNEVMVLLGDNYFAERSAMQAAEIMQRRVNVIDGIVDKTEKKINDITARDIFSHEARQALLRKMENGTDTPAVPKDVEERAEEDDDDEGLVSFQFTCHCANVLRCRLSTFFLGGGLCRV